MVGTRDQGKTTLLKIASGVERPDRSSVRVGGLELKGLKDRELVGLLRTEIGLAARDGPECGGFCLPPRSLESWDAPR